MPYRYVEPDVFLEHKGVSIFPVYRSGTDEPWTYWFTTDPATCDDECGHGERGHFDARMLAARWSETPTVAQWDDFWKPRFKREHEAIDALIRGAIDEDRLPQSAKNSSMV